MQSFAPYPSLTVLRDEHRTLLQNRREDGNTAVFITQISTFIQRGTATGVLLAAESDRFDAQNLLDFWENELHHLQREAPEATLAEYDPELAPELDDTLSPYIGLDAFNAQNSSLFYGRETIVNEMIAHLENGRFLAISGLSGSGKSSIAQAGLLPKLQTRNESAHWHYFPRFTPGLQPIRNLAQTIQPSNTPSNWLAETIAQMQSEASTLSTIIRENTSATAVLYIDQFEELYTLDSDPDIRQPFFANLLHYIQDPATQNRLIITMRTDFESRLTQTEELQRLYQNGQFTIKAMTATELHTVIIKPAEQVGLQFEDGIPDQLVRDVLGEPSALPLLQFALLELWKHRYKNRITWQTYSEVGGAQIALSQAADRLYDSIGPKAQAALKHIFRQLIRPLPGLEVTRQPTNRVTLYTSKHNPEIIDSVLAELDKANLIHVTAGTTANEDRVELTHEALVRSWPRLATWLAESRVQQRKRLRLTSMAQQWDALERDDSALLRGLVLQEAAQYDDLDELESHFVQASHNAANHEEAAAEAARQQELKTVRRNNRRLLLLTLLLLFFFGTAMIFAIFARMSLAVAQESIDQANAAQATAVSAQSTAVWNANVAATAQADANAQQQAAIIDRDAAQQSAQLAVAAQQDAETERNNAETARNEAEANARQSLARQLSSQAINQLQSDPALALLLAVEGAYIPLAAQEFVPLEITDALYRAIEASQLQRTLPGHADRITAVSLIPSNDNTPARILSSSLDGTAKVWDASNGQELRTLRDHTAGIIDLAANPSQNLWATAGLDGRITLYTLDTLTRQAQYASDSNAPVKAIALSPDGTQLAAAFAGSLVIVWEIANNTPAYFLFDLQEEINDLTFTPDGRLLALAGEKGTLSIRNATTGVPINGLIQEDSNGQPIPISALAYSPDGTLLAAILQNSSVRIFANKADGLTPINNIPGQTQFTGIAFNPQNNNLVTGSGDNSAKVWDVTTGELIYTLAGHNGAVSAVAYSADGEQIVTGSQDSIVRLWRTGTGTEPIILSGHSAPINALAYNEDGTQIATASDDNTAIVWNPENGAILHTFSRHDGPVNDLAFDPTNNYLATASDDRIVRLFDLETEEITAVFRHDASVRAIAFNPSGTVLVSGGDDGLLYSWEMATQSNLQTFNVGAPIRDLAYHPTENVVAVASDTAVSFWNLDTLVKINTIPIENGLINQITFSYDGSRLATASNDGSAILWQYPSGDLLRTFIGHSGSVNDVAFSPDDTFLATAGADRTARIWEVATGANVRIVRGHTGGITAVSFTPNPTEPHLATASQDGNAQITPLTEIEALFVQAWRLLERPLTPTECIQYHHTQPCLTTNITQPPPITP